MPFVRDARGAPTIPGVLKPVPTPAPAPAATKTAAAPAAAASGPEAELSAAIGAKGEEVRALKVAKVCLVITV
jgi:hypothetical protein